MGKKRTGALVSLLGLSMVLAACDAITAQNIPSTTSTAFNNGAGLGGANAQMGMPGGGFGGGFGGNTGGMREAIDSDLIGRITAVNGNTLTLALLERGSTVAGDGAQSPGGAADGQTEWITTGEQKQLGLSENVEVSSGATSRSGDPSKLKTGQIVMVWYAEGAQTAERIRILE